MKVTTTANVLARPVIEDMKTERLAWWYFCCLNMAWKIPLCVAARTPPGRFATGSKQGEGIINEGNQNPPGQDFS